MFSSVQIKVGFQPEPQFTFRYTTISVKLGFMAVFSLQLPLKGLLPKVDSTVAPMHYCSKLVNPSTPRCPIKSTTNKFPRLTVKASWYSSTFDLSYLNLSKNFLLQPYVVVQQNCNQCSTVGATACGQSLPPLRSSRCHLLSPWGV
jgi:hypothetical protein